METESPFFPLVGRVTCPRLGHQISDSLARAFQKNNYTYWLPVESIDLFDFRSLKKWFLTLFPCTSERSSYVRLTLS